MGSAVPTGFLEKNRDVLSMDVLTLVQSSQNKFLRDIFKCESADTKLGHGTIVRGKAGNLLSKVGPPRSAGSPQGPQCHVGGVRGQASAPEGVVVLPGTSALVHTVTFLRWSVCAVCVCHVVHVCHMRDVWYMHVACGMYV